MNHKKGYTGAGVLMAVVISSLFRAQAQDGGVGSDIARSQLAERPKPIVVSEAVGDTLDLLERDHYRLFPRLSGFQWAVLYLNEDGSLRAHIVLFDGGIYRDSIIMRYSTLNSLQNHINRIGMIKKSESDVGPTRNAIYLEFLGKYVFGMGINYERFVADQLSISIGAGYVPSLFGSGGDPISSICVRFLPESFLYFDFGTSVLFDSYSSPDYFKYVGFGFISKRNLFFKIGPIFFLGEEGLVPWIGVSLGASF